MHWVSGGFLSKFSDCWAFGDMVRIWRAFFESQVTLSTGRNTPLTNSDDTSKFWVFRYPWRFPIIATNRCFVRPRCRIVSGVSAIYWPNSFRLWGRNLKCSFELNFAWSPFSPNSGIVCFGSFFFGIFSQVEFIVRMIAKFVFVSLFWEFYPVRWDMKNHWKLPKIWRMERAMLAYAWNEDSWEAQNSPLLS